MKRMIKTIVFLLLLYSVLPEPTPKIQKQNIINNIIIEEKTSVKDTTIQNKACNISQEGINLIKHFERFKIKSL